jgi:hypothetical protein
VNVLKSRIIFISPHFAPRISPLLCLITYFIFAYVEVMAWKELEMLKPLMHLFFGILLFNPFISFTIFELSQFS